jgi:DnaJ-class molecular chaperone
LTAASCCSIPRVRQLIKIASTKDFYKVLGVTRAASDSQIKKAYRSLTLRNHPDKLAHKGEQERKIAESKIKELNEAYDVLSDSTKKRRYDAGVDPDHLDDEPMGGMGGGGMRGGGMRGGGMDVPPEVLAAMFGAMGGGMGGGFGGGGARRGRRGGGGGGGMPAGMHFGF